MADISAEIAAFQNAVYGEEVRGSMISAIEKINDVAEDAEDTVGEFSSGFQDAVNSCSDAADAANAAASEADAAAATANTSASAASSAAETANTAASNATAQANAASQLNTTVQQAEAARRTAESARVTAENSRVAAETARAGSESNRNNAEATRQENETNRNTAEVSRINAEATRQAQETSRQSAESSRTTAEQNRASTFSAMQQSFSEMEQQVLPPATYSTLGGVIIDSSSGLQVASDGTLSFTAGDFLTASEAAATYATITTVDGKANAQHNHSATDINNGTLAVARGGTGVTTAAAERERLGLGSTTDALPVANGGTGATTATGALANLGAYSATEVDTALADYLPLAGGALTDSIIVENNLNKSAIYKKGPINLNTPPSSGTVYESYVAAIDVNGNSLSYLQAYHNSSDRIGTILNSTRTVNGSPVYHGITFEIDASGNRNVILNDPQAFRAALGLGSSLVTSYPAAMNVANNTGTNVASVSLSAGLWLITAGGFFAANANGDRYIHVTETSGNVDAERIRSAKVRAASSGSQVMSLTCLYSVSTTKTVYLVAHQTSGSTLSCSGGLSCCRIN